MCHLSRLNNDAGNSNRILKLLLLSISPQNRRIQSPARSIHMQNWSICMEVHFAKFHNFINVCTISSLAALSISVTGIPIHTNSKGWGFIRGFIGEGNWRLHRFYYTCWSITYNISLRNLVSSHSCLVVFVPRNISSWLSPSRVS